jgi:signal transduction histidine kinase
VILLLAVAVILPTVCLLWFMSQAVKNERLAMRQKLVEAYHKPLKRAAEKVDSIWKDKSQPGPHLYSRFPGYIFQKLVIKPNAIHDSFDVDGVLIYDVNGILVYPAFSTDIVEEKLPLEELKEARHLEFVEQKLPEAIEAYQRTEKIVGSFSGHCYISAHSWLGEARCLMKLNDEEGAARAYDNARSLIKKIPRWLLDSRFAGQKLELTRLQLYAELMLLRIRKADRHAIQVAISRACDREKFLKDVPSDIRLFYAAGVLKVFEDNKPHDSAMTKRGLQLARMVQAEELSMDAAKYYPNAPAFSEWPAEAWRRLFDSQYVYAARYKFEEYTLLLLLKRESVIEDLHPYHEFLNQAGLAYRIVDQAGQYVCGVYSPKVKPILKTTVGKYLPDWQISVYVENPKVYENAAKKQIALYIWAGVLVIVLILAAGGFVGQAVGKQIKLNRLKNDFIATVSHELKTPLASMRVLADTLLEGNYKDQKQATEYLNLICKENKRLSGLIDNFLTFSRMERNKHAFEMADTSPAVIANAAVEAVKTKYSEGQCDFEVKISDDLPDVSADHDAMVTVLVNLLDNANKYSHDDKHIEFRVFTEDGLVCFSVSDNGIGLSQRAIKKIFKRFYQVDRSLSRRSEGCGLGLSIAKFIVDAHKGSISVDSKPGTGSTFTVKLPAVN